MENYFVHIIYTVNQLRFIILVFWVYNVVFGYVFKVNLINPN